MCTISIARLSGTSSPVGQVTLWEVLHEVGQRLSGTCGPLSAKSHEVSVFLQKRLPLHARLFLSGN